MFVKTDLNVHKIKNVIKTFTFILLAVIHLAGVRSKFNIVSLLIQFSILLLNSMYS